MRVLFTDATLPYLLRDDDFPVGGWAVQLRQLAVAMRAEGHAVGVLTWEGANAYVGPQSVCELIETFDKTKGIRRLRLFYYFLPSLIAAARRFKPDVIVQSCAATETGSMALVADLLGVPFVHRIAADTDADGRYADRLRWHERIAFRLGLLRARLVICQNEVQRKSINQLYPDMATVVVHNAIETPAQPTKPKDRRQRGYVAWLGVFRRQKNLPLLLEIARATPTVQFRVAGGYGDNLDSLTTATLKALEALPNVELVGYLKREDVAGFLENAIALLATSDFEGFSNAFLEALVVGTPVVARRQIDPDGIIAKHRLGAIADDAGGLLPALRSVTDLNEKAYGDLAGRCQDHVISRHRPEVAARVLIQAFKDIA